MQYSVKQSSHQKEIFRCMDTDGSGNINIKELIDFLEAVGGGDIDKKIVKSTKCHNKIYLKGYF